MTSAVDWAAVINALLERGLTMRAVGDAMQLQLTARMLQHYESGVQPAHFRGEGLIALWCRTTGEGRDALPMREVVRGHRVAHASAAVAGPFALPQWPPAAAVAVNPVRRRGRPRKALGVA